MGWAGQDRAGRAWQGRTGQGGQGREWHSGEGIGTARQGSERQGRAGYGAGRNIIGQNRRQDVRQSGVNKAEGMADGVTQKQSSVERRAEVKAKAVELYFLQPFIFLLF